VCLPDGKYVLQVKASSPIFKRTVVPDIKLPAVFFPLGGGGKKMAGLLHRTAQPPTLAAFRPWEGSAGAGRVRPAGAKIRV